MTFGDRLKLLRDEKGLTQQSIADILNVGRATVAGYETKGKQPDFDKLKKLCQLFNVSVDYLLGLSDIANPYKTVELPTSDFIIDQVDYMSYKKYLEEKQLESTLDNGNTHNKLRQKSESLAERFLDLLIDAGEIKTKEDLTTDKVFKILNKIFDELKEDTK